MVKLATTSERPARKLMRRLAAVLGLALVVFCGFVGREVPVTEQIDALSYVATIATVIFGVSGAWLSILLGLSSSDVNTDTVADWLSKLRWSFVVSALAVVSYLLLVVAHPMVVRLGSPLPLPWTRGLLFATICALSFGVCITLIAVAVIPADELLKILSKRQAHDEIANGYSARRKEQEKKRSTVP